MGRDHIRAGTIRFFLINTRRSQTVMVKIFVNIQGRVNIDVEGKAISGLITSAELGIQAAEEDGTISLVEPFNHTSVQMDSDGLIAINIIVASTGCTCWAITALINCQIFVALPFPELQSAPEALLFDPDTRPFGVDASDLAMIRVVEPPTVLGRALSRLFPQGTLARDEKRRVPRLVFSATWRSLASSPHTSSSLIGH